MAKPAAWQRPPSLRSTARPSKPEYLRSLIRGLRRTRMLWVILLAFWLLSGCAEASLTVGL